MRHLLASLVLAASLPAAEYWASPNGSAGNAGTAASPWNLAKAGSTPVAGDTVRLAAGIYAQRLVVTVSGNATAGRITYRGEPGAIIDGTSIAIPAGGDFTGLVHLDGRRFVRIEGLEVRNWKTTNGGAMPVGIYVGASAGVTSDIQIVGNRVHDIWQRAANAGAHGIAVYGDNATAISGLLVQNNEVDHCQVGWSETLVLNGNINGFEVSDNRIHDNNNIGIDLIGYEGTSPSTTTDFVRNGLVARNTVTNIHTNGYDASSANASYPTNDDSAGGIYVDGARDMVIERNTVTNCDIGIEIGAEHTDNRNSINVTVRSNVVATTVQGCLQFGGYAAGLSWAENCQVSHNTCYNADTKGQGYGLIVLKKSRNCTFRHNLLVGKSGGFMVSSSLGAANTTGHVLDWNAYWTVGGTPQFQLGSVSASGLAAFRTASGQDAHSLQADPQLAALSGTLDLRPRSTSPVIDAGDPAFVASGLLDRTGVARVLGTRTDMGAYEQSRTVGDMTPPTLTAVAVSGITTGGATIAWTTNEAASTQVEYGLTTAYGSSSPQVATLTTAHSVALSGLTAATTYHVRVRSADAAGNLAIGTDVVFTTATATGDVTPPVLSGVVVKSTTAYGATIGWTTNEASNTQVEYGRTTAYGSRTTVNAGLVTAHSILVAGLSPGVTYHYRVRSADAAGNLAVGVDAVFTTSSDATAPVLSAIAAGSVTANSATITWTSSEPATTQVNFGTTTAYGTNSTLVSALTTGHSVVLNGLVAATTYHVRVRSADASSNLALGADLVFTTAAPAAATASLEAVPAAVTPGGSAGGCGGGGFAVGLLALAMLACRQQRHPR